MPERPTTATATPTPTGEPTGPVRARGSRRAGPGGGARGLAALLLVGALVLAACSDDGGGARSGATTTTSGPSSGGQAGPDEDPGSGTSPVQDGIRIEVLSSQPDRATGPDARVRVSPARGRAAADLRVDLGGRDVTDQLPVVDGAREGVVTGLVEGTNTLTARADGATVTQRIRSWPLSGPMISGPHLPLLACSTEAHGLGRAEDPNCSAPTRVTWRYVTTAGTIADLPDPSGGSGDLPDDIATATIGGREDVPLVVRHEQGVVNRSVYEIATVDPSPGGADTDQGDAAWNGRLLYRYGGGCGTTYGQGTSRTTALAPEYLEQGYALATATFNTFAVQCNDVLSAETTMMVKERFIEEFGEPTATIGEGEGEGAAQLHLLAQNYPGLIDGAVALRPLPDVASVLGGATDCGLLDRYYGTPAGAGLTENQRRAINGHASSLACRNWAAAYRGALDPADGCDPAIPAGQIYDPVANPAGLRCTFQDANRNQFERDEATGFAARTLDNVGIQYGLEALNEGVISFDQFVALNRAVGGYDGDGAPQRDRTEADPLAVQAAYETGRVATGVGDQRKIPFLEVDVYADPAGAVPDRLQAFSMRDRLTQGQGAARAPGFQIWTRDPGPLAAGDTLAAAVARGRYGPEAVAVLDEWLAAIEEDDEGGDRTEVLRRTRPEAAVDNCLLPDRTEPLSAVDLYEEAGPCRDRYPVAGNPRIAAGAPRANDVLKCELKAVDPADYEIDLTVDQYEELLATFPVGVCDWSVAGVGQTTPSMSDRSYEDVVTPEQLA